VDIAPGDPGFGSLRAYAASAVTQEVQRARAVDAARRWRPGGALSVLLCEGAQIRTVSPPARCRHRRAMFEKYVLQLARLMQGNAGFLGFGLENACV